MTLPQLAIHDYSFWWHLWKILCLKRAINSENSGLKIWHYGDPWHKSIHSHGYIKLIHITYTKETFWDLDICLSLTKYWLYIIQIDQKRITDLSNMNKISLSCFIPQIILMQTLSLGKIKRVAITTHAEYHQRPFICFHIYYCHGLFILQLCGFS